MGFFEGLFKTWTGRSSKFDRDQILKHWGLDESENTESEASEFDRTNWRKKLQHLLDRLPASEPEWKDFLADAYALEFDEAWLQRTYREEFRLLVRRAVADHIVTDAEHRKLDMALSVLGLSNAEGETIFNEVVADAESFFGTKVEGA